ncbi:helix-turn-helix domain-containing protein [Kitasatospora sp. NPDC088783]|uniref:helix-turn-helix domain-containing protein n=1 Tax=Kitasatospora sp. NPDC088783 TaxID=3364077 RepID=UPI0038253327
MPHARTRAARDATPPPPSPSTQGCACTRPGTSALLRTTDEAAAVINVSPRTLRRWRRENTGPAYAKVGSQIGYRDQDLVDYLARSLVVPEEAA